jgi:hypothetical protein
MDPQTSFLSNLKTIEQIIAIICRRHFLTTDDQEEFESYAKFRLLENDYAVFAKFQGRARSQRI